MAKGYTELNKLINETVNIIQDVSIASDEQLKGIEQINATVSMLDRVTQENAMEANSVSEIANNTLKMAKLLVQDAKTKKTKEI